MVGTSARGTCWSITINNPQAADEENINLARQKGWKVEGQLEVGEQGTPHYQLKVNTPQVRFSAVKKAFPRAHIELAKNVFALEQYVHKEETREGELVHTSDRYPSMQKLWELFYDWVDDNRKFMAMQSWTEDDFLTNFDLFIKDAIMVQGYFVETMAVNPQIRAVVKKYGYEILMRVQNIRRQTDRQTDENLVEYIDIPNANEEGNEEDSTASSVSS